jgi:CheY-like chemotaxis protein
VRVLLVEESRVMRQILVRALRQTGLDGHDVLPAEDGRAGLRLAREEQPDVVVCGWNVPGLSGAELVSSLRLALGHRRLVVVSAETASPAVAAAAHRAGADAVLAKPVTPEALAEAVTGGGSPLRPGDDAETGPETDPQAPAHVPTPFEVRDALTTLLSRDVEVDAGDPFSGEDARTTYAVYVDDRLAARVVAVADVGFSAHAGAAVGLVPAPLAASTVRRGTLPDLLAENLDEVLNVCAAALNGPGRPHLRLWAVHHAGEDAPPDVVGFAAVPGRRLDLLVTIPSYGEGRLSFVAVD